MLLIVQNGATVWVLNASSGNGEYYEEQNRNFPDDLVNGVAITRNELHEVYRQNCDGWREGDLGEIYRPKYSSGGQAIHGSNNVPNYAASHGCVRVSDPAMEHIWEHDLMPLHTPVWVHGEL
jgi:lipoprotein-anchoring transpeptidase ErfK/SrfK